MNKLDLDIRLGGSVWCEKCESYHPVLPFCPTLRVRKALERRIKMSHHGEHVFDIPTLESMKDEMKHTPGPWTVEVTQDSWGNDEFDIMDSGGCTLLTGFVHRKDDALLMAAAPELLQALADIQECCNEYVGSGPLKTINEIASDAISKARTG